MDLLVRGELLSAQLALARGDLSTAGLSLQQLETLIEQEGLAIHAPGMVALIRPNGSAEVVAEGIAFPNGMAISPDGSTLVVADSYAKELIGFRIGSDGSLSGRRTCRTCNHIWHVDFDPPQVEGVCDLDQGELYQRDDDKPETVHKRLDTYR